MNTFDRARIPPSRVADLIKTEVLGEEAKEGPIPEVEPKKAEIARDISILPIKIILLVVVILSAVTSGYFIYEWSVASRGIALSLSIAISMTACQVLLPELAIMLAMKKTVSAVCGAIIVSVIAIVATTFTMGATIGGIYDARSSAIQKGRDDALSSAKTASISGQLESAREKKGTLKNQLLWAQNEAAQYANEVSEVLRDDNATVSSVSRAESKRDKAKAGIDRILAEVDKIDAIIASLEANPESVTVVRDDFYSWTAKILHTSSEKVEFVMSAFPAIFNEIVAPTMLAVVLFL